MPNTKSAIQRVRRVSKQTSVNRIRKSKYKSAIKQMSIYLDSRKMKEAVNFLPKFHSQLMKVAKTGAISKKTASRKISRITKKINKSKLDQLVVTDTIPLSDSATACKKIRVISLAPTLAEAIRRVNNEESISAMFL